MNKMVAIIALMSSMAYAMDWTAEVDLRNTATDSSMCGGAAGCAAGTQLLFGAGATTKFDFGNNFGVRTGGLLTQRGVKATTAGSDSSANYMHIDVPVLAEYAISESFMINGGLVVGLKASSAYSNVTNVTDKSLITPIQIGAAYAINKAWKADFLYEMGTSIGNTTTTDLKTANVISIGGGYSF
jgi:hypothetical protein